MDSAHQRLFGGGIADVDGRDKPGHDKFSELRSLKTVRSRRYPRFGPGDRPA
jgi:hypothetical protein